MICLVASERDRPFLAPVRASLEALAPVRTLAGPADLASDAALVVTPFPEPALVARAAALRVPLWTWLFGEPWEDPVEAHRRGRRWLRVRLIELAPDTNGWARVRYEGAFKTHPLGPSRTLARVWPAVADWPARVLAARLPEGNAAPRLLLSSTPRRHSSLPDLLFALPNLWRRVCEMSIVEDWRIGLLPRPPAGLLDRPTLEDALWLPPRPGGGFFADPFGIETAEGRFIFVEDCPPGTVTAGLAVLWLDHANQLVDIVPVETDLRGHLSYPFLFEWDGRLWLLPEHGVGGHTVLLECVRFPHRFRTAAELLADFPAIDPTLYVARDRLWLFATNGREEDVTRLYLFHARSPQGPWRPHPLNPVVCDIRASRPAGPVFTARGALFRPAQDCSERYGGALTLCRIERLDERAFAQRIVLRVPPPTRLSDGAHTLAPLGKSWSVIDAKRQRRELTTTLRRLAQRLARG